MKVVHLAHYYWPHVGGIEKHLALLAQELATKNVETIVVTKQYASTLPKQEIHAGCTIYRLAVNETTALRHKISVWKEIWRIRNVLFSANILHVHDVVWWVYLLAPLLFLRGKKIYVTFHGYEGSKNPTRRQILSHKLAEFLTAGNLCIGGFHEKYYKVSPTLTSFGAVKPVSKGNVPKKNTAIFIGRLEHDTGFFEYLQAIKILQNRGLKWQLHVYGEGSLAQKAETFVKKHALLVTFHGFIPAADTKLPGHAVAFVSRYLAILEALAAEIPIIAQYTTEIKKDYLVLSPFSQWITIVSSPEEIAEAVENLSAPSKAGAQWARKQSWKKMAQTYLQLWKVT